MEKHTLTSKELVTLASFTDKNYFYGVANPFFGMSEKDINETYDKVKFELDKKGYIKCGFDGSTTITERGNEILNKTIYANVYCFIDGLVDGNKNNRFSIYKSDNAEVIFKYDKDDVIIEEGNIDSFIKMLDDTYLSINNKADNDEKECSCKINDLVEIKKEIDKKKNELSFKELIDFGSKLLMSKGLDKNIAECTVKGILNNCNYVSVMSGNTKERNLKTIQLIITADKIIMMEIVAEDEAIVKYKSVDKKAIKEKIISTLNG